jgi:hypothetical protein
MSLWPSIERHRARNCCPCHAKLKALDEFCTALLDNLNERWLLGNDVADDARRAGYALALTRPWAVDHTVPRTVTESVRKLQSA